MSQSVRARYEGGIFRPLERVDLPEGTTVEMSIAPAGWEDRMRALLERVRARVTEVTPDDVEAEITHAAAEVRAKRLGNG